MSVYSAFISRIIYSVRLFSYFLADNEELCDVIDSSASKLKSLIEDDQKEASPRRRRENDNSVSIRNGTLIDPQGSVAIALTSALEISLPISNICLHAIAMSLPPRLFLAAFNLSLVGLSSPAHAVTNSVSRTTLAHNQATASASSSSNSATRDRFQLEYVMDDRDVNEYPCFGFGIVSDVDLSTKSLHVIIPSDDVGDAPIGAEQCYSVSRLLGECLLSGRSIHLSRGSIQLPSTVMFSPEGQACTPYLSSENSGEGSSQARNSRTNLKRRSQVQM
jgi:hypothetical protein